VFVSPQIIRHHYINNYRTKFIICSVNTDPVADEIINLRWYSQNFLQSFLCKDALTTIEQVKVFVSPHILKHHYINNYHKKFVICFVNTDPVADEIMNLRWFSQNILQ
jgi:hypothetical protein